MFRKKQFVKSQLTDALIKLMCKKPLRDISVSKFTLCAQVGRASFYRNYKEKEDILREYTAQLLEKWRCGYDKHGSTDISEMFGSLFAHFKSNKKYYSLLYRQGLSNLLLDTIIKICGAKLEQSNAEAYFAAFMSYGLYGWINEWFARGMTESAETMTKLLLKSRLKDTGSVS